MKKIVFGVVLLCIGAFSVSAQRSTQVKTEKFDIKMKDMLKEDTEPMFKRNVAPAEFKDESVVTLAQKVRIKFYGTGINTSSLTYVHTRILLNDLAALEEFSDFTFDEPNSSNAMQVNIIKKGGKVEAVNLADAVADEKKINASRYGFNFSEVKKKIALKNLEVGDILEYVGLFDKWQSDYSTTYYFAGERAVVASKIVYEVEKNNFYVAYKNINNAPPFVMTKDKSGTHLYYTVNDTMRKRYEEVPEDVVALTEPLFKMRVLPKHISRISNFSYQLGKAKTTLTEKDLKQEVWAQVSELSNGSTEYYIDYVEKYGYNQQEDEFIKTYFYFLRDRLFTETTTFDEKPQTRGLGLMNKLIRAAQKRNIPYEVVLFSDRTEGRFEDILFEEELYWGVVFNTRDGDVGFYSFHQYSHPDELPTGYEGTTAYRYKIGSSMTKTTVEKWEVPVTPETHNIDQTITEAVFVGGLDSLKMNEQVVKKGYYRNITKFDLNNRYDNFNQYLKQLKEEKVITNDDLRYYFITSGAYINFDKVFMDNEERRCREVFRQNQSDMLKRYFEKSHQNEKYTLLKFKNYKIISDSRPADHNWVEWDEEYVIGGIARQINDKMIVLEIGEIFSGMYQINSDKNREVRTKPFVIGVNRSYINELKLKLPDGYQIKDLSPLNKTFENKIGTFTTVATLNGNTLHIVLTKTYKADTYPKEDWPAYITFLDTAAGFNQVKIVLEK